MNIWVISIKKEPVLLILRLVTGLPVKGILHVVIAVTAGGGKSMFVKTPWASVFTLTDLSLNMYGSNIVPLDNRIPDEWAAIMDPFGNATHTALSFPLLGEDVLITGAGLIGSMAIAIAKYSGARFIVASDLSDYRLDIARKMGATLTVNASRGEKISDAVEKLGMRGFDVGLEMSGSPKAFIEMISNMYNGSSISLLGILPSDFEVPWSDIIFKAITLKGIYGREMWETWYKMEMMIIGGINLDPVITHRFYIDDFQKGFDIMEEGNCGKVILNWD